MECGIEALDRLWADEGAPPVARDDRESVAAVQALLIGHGYTHLPTVTARDCGVYGPQTIGALRHFQTQCGLDATGAIDARTFRKLVSEASESPVISTPYAAFVLDIEVTGLLRPATITMQLEGGGSFVAANWNTDRCGLSFGLIQWAQKPGRLHELLVAWRNVDSAQFTALMGGGSAAVAEGLLAHTRLPNGGVSKATGKTVNDKYDLVAEPWRTRFLAAGRIPALQKAQVEIALAAFTISAERIRRNMPLVVSERALAFMLDVANQFGDGGANSVAAAVARPGMTEAEFLAAVGAETTARVARQYGKDSAEARSTANRRDVMRKTPWLADVPATFV